ncbi:hypothetical protein E3O25_02130 [Cryobacterium sp. TMT1-3]|uniref:DUF1648 domain-containing protein n=1 Tax=Cryobacterium luteum TaxID=1424661 RepID=A0A5F0DFD8_9MICO|nr:MULTISPECIES: hypothetical protein [Cryobacterium]TFB95571.1 hypothetical protein E3O10_00585 [Cryobacterium luteum]TFC31278.1 hypothetical protein E3O25_02130 [Cryobacterium sp. TMT1-3]
MTLVNSSAPTRSRDVAAAATLWLPVVAVVVTWLLWIDRLPSVLPRQWGSDGAVSSTIPTWAMAVIAFGVSLGAAILATGWLRERRAPNRRQVYVGLGFAAGLASSLWLMTAGITIDAGDAEPKLGAWLLLTFAACGYGALPYFLAQKWMPPVLPEPPTTENDNSKIDLSMPWSTLVTSPVIAVIGGGVVLGGAVAIFVLLTDAQQTLAASVMTGVVVGVILLVTLVFVQVRVTVDGRGLSVVSRLLGIRLKKVSLDQVESAFADTVSALQYGGWGYRLTSGRTAVVMRGGPALVVNLRRGNQFAVTVDEPHTAAALLNALRAANPSVR